MRQSIRVQIIDDSADVINSFQLLLGGMGYEARTSSDPEASIALAKDWKPDVILLDLAMPFVSGYALAPRLRSETGLGDSVRIVALSGYALNADALRAATIQGHILKPCNRAMLKSAIEAN